MELDKDRTEYNRITEENRLFNFLSGLNSQFDAIRREILRLERLPTVGEGYAAVRKEAARLRILNGIGEGDLSSGGIGAGFVSRKPTDRQQARNHRGRPDPELRTARSGAEKVKLRCSHCNMTGHTRETCYKLVGYPEWWEDGHRDGQRTGSPRNARAAVAVEGSEATSRGDGEGEEESTG